MTIVDKLEKLKHNHNLQSIYIRNNIKKALYKAKPIKIDNYFILIKKYVPYPLTRNIISHLKIL